MIEQEKFLDLGRYGLEIDNITLKTTTGQDEIMAEQRAAGRGAHAFLEELMADAIVAVNGERVVTPYVQWKEWSTRTRAFVRAAFNQLNDASKEEIRDFLADEFAEPSAVANVVDES